MGSKFIRELSVLAWGAALSASAFPALAEKCAVKGGKATGVTRGFAEYESLLIIRQATGNWPFETDRIGKPAYSCKQDGVLWTCHATATVCRS